MTNLIRHQIIPKEEIICTAGVVLRVGLSVYLVFTEALTRTPEFTSLGHLMFRVKHNHRFF